jgi:hypothetical protein
MNFGLHMNLSSYEFPAAAFLKFEHKLEVCGSRKVLTALPLDKKLHDPTGYQIITGDEHASTEGCVNTPSSNISCASHTSAGNQFVEDYNLLTSRILLKAAKKRHRRLRFLTGNFCCG